MNGLNSYIPQKLPIITLICTLFITYPNVVWIPWNLARLNVGEAPRFLDILCLPYALFLWAVSFPIKI